ncbi:hypothetical protein BDP27DRAFT_1357112 [Rhodocollybia butyracea]|uniref:Uncharacterized protein n=1 Tax=Rhodocollybia butyracea TaxID=206335 RepID=A0A9P5UFV7_9AGAR|nr:hypothetical protein BDP27DRAFT_1357112 [Rhodocollybia butyracea]
MSITPFFSMNRLSSANAGTMVTTCYYERDNRRQRGGVWILLVLLLAILGISTSFCPNVLSIASSVFIFIFITGLFLTRYWERDEDYISLLVLFLTLVLVQAVVASTITLLNNLLLTFLAFNIAFIFIISACAERFREDHAKYGLIKNCDGFFAIGYNSQEAESTPLVSDGLNESFVGCKSRKAKDAISIFGIDYTGIT